MADSRGPTRVVPVVKVPDRPGEYVGTFAPPLSEPPATVCWEYQAGANPIRLSFAIKVY